MPTICDAGEDLVIFTSFPSSSMRCQANAGSDQTGTLVVSDFNALVSKGYGWLQGGMLCYNLGCDQPSSDGDAAGGSVGFGPTPAPVPIDANMVGDGSTFMSKAGTVQMSGNGIARVTGTVRQRSVSADDNARKLLAASSSNWGKTGTSVTWGTPITSYNMAPPPVPIPAPVVLQVQCRFGVCRPKGTQQMLRASGP